MEEEKCGKGRKLRNVNCILKRFVTWNLTYICYYSFCCNLRTLITLQNQVQVKNIFVLLRLPIPVTNEKTHLVPMEVQTPFSQLFANL